MKHEHKEKMKKAGPYIAGIIIIAVIVLLLVLRGGHAPKAEAPASSGTTASATATIGILPVKSAVPAAKPAMQASQFKTPSIASTVSNVSSSDGDSATDPKRATYSVMFNVIATGSDVYFAPSCQSVAAPESKTGVTFELLKGGSRADNSGFVKESCAVLNRGLAKQAASGSYFVPKGQQNLFELVVADHPKTSGSYSLRITSVGYSATDGGQGVPFSVSNFDLGRLKTVSVQL